MLKLDVIIIAVAISWFLCSERPETDEQDLDSDMVSDANDTITETADTPAEHGILRGWVRLGSLVALVVIVLKTI